jgi:CRISPR-associated exonuclease Cas4
LITAPELAAEALGSFLAEHMNSRFGSSRDEEARVVTELCARLIGNLELKFNDSTRRRLAPGDIALLAPVSTDLWRYERALEEAGLPFV